MSRTKRSPLWQARNRKIWAMTHECGLGEEILRDIVEEATGSRSVSGMSERDQVKVLVALTAAKGQIMARRRRQKKRIGNERGDRVTRRQVAELRRLAEALGWGKPALRAWLKRWHQTEREEWLTASRASIAIQGLRAISERKKASQG